MVEDMEIETVFMLHRSQSVCEVEIMVQDMIWDGGVVCCVEDVV